MSQVVRIDFKANSIEVQTNCELASKSLCKINKSIDWIHENASLFSSKELTNFEQSLLNDKNEIQKQLDKVYRIAEDQKAKENLEGYEENLRQESLQQDQLKAECKKLVNLVNELTGEKLFGFKKFVDDKLNNTFKNVKVFGATDPSVLKEIENIQDPLLQSFVFELTADHKGRTFEELLELGKAKYHAYLNESKQDYIKEVQNELKENHIPEEIIQEVVNKDNIQDISSHANQAIMDESNRKKALSSIIKSIKSRGFVVDTKKNLKIDRKTNIVNLVAIKPDGKTAEFKISLNGQFMYNFEGYEGHACSKDIGPFMDDLEKIYGFKVMKKEIIDQNPDKIQTQKYQYYNENKGTN